MQNLGSDVRLKRCHRPQVCTEDSPPLKKALYDTGNSSIPQFINYSYSSNNAHTMPTEHRKEGVASAEEIKEFIAAAGDKLFIADVRNPDAVVEPGDVKSIGLSPLPTPETRPLAKNLTFDREAKTMPLPDVPKDYYIITHCGAGSRGQEAKIFLEQNGFVNVLNGGGPKEKELWEIYGDK